MAHILEARVEEIFDLALQEIKRSGYDGLLPAGMILTGGTSLLPGIRQLASKVLGMPVRTAQPEKLVGLVDKLGSPAYSTSIGLLYWAAAMQSVALIESPRKQHQNQHQQPQQKGESQNWNFIKSLLKRLLP